MANPSLEWITVMNDISTVNVLIKVQVLTSKKYEFIYPELCRVSASDQGLFKFMQFNTHKIKKFFHINILFLETLNW